MVNIVTSNCTENYLVTESSDNIVVRTSAPSVMYSYAVVLLPSGAVLESTVRNDFIFS